MPPGGALGVRVAREGARLALRWSLDGPAGAWSVPAPGAAPARRDRLWETTCFEVFLAPAGQPAYWEVNMSPAGDWNVYRFDGERTGMREEPRVRPPALDASTDAAGRFTLAASLDLTPIATLATAPLDAGVAAVLATTSGVCSYWAVRHTRPHPDFHARDGFVVRLDP